MPANADEGIHRRPANERFRTPSFQRKLRSGFGRGNAFLLEHFPAAAVEHLEREVIEPLAEAAVIAVEDDDGINRRLFPQVHFPPGIGRILLRVRLPPAAVGVARVAVDAASRFTAVRGVFLRGILAAGHVSPVAIDFHFGQRQRAISRKLHSHIAATGSLSLATTGEFFRQSGQQRLDPGINAGAEAEVRDKRSRGYEILQRASAR